MFGRLSRLTWILTGCVFEEPMRTNSATVNRGISPLVAYAAFRLQR